MADFRELTASRTGGVKGFNATTEIRIIRVIAEAEDIETVRGTLGTQTVYPDLRDLVENQLIRIGSGHPWDREGLKAGSYRNLENRGQGQGVVEVTYYRNNVTIGIPPTNTWLIRYRGATITEQALTELPPDTATAQTAKSTPSVVRMGAHARRAGVGGVVPTGSPAAGTADDVWTRPSREVGSKAFKEVDTKNVASHEAKGIDSETGLPVDIWLKELEGLTEQPRGMQVEAPAWLVTFERTLPNFGTGRFPVDIALYMKAVNGVEFRGAQPLHVKCLDVVLDPIAAEIPGQREAGIAYRAVISFLWSYFPWGPYGLVNGWFDGDGHRATALIINPGQPDDGEPDVSEFRNVRRADLDGLLTALVQG